MFFIFIIGIPRLAQRLWAYQDGFLEKKEGGQGGHADQQLHLLLIKLHDRQKVHFLTTTRTVKPTNIGKKDGKNNSFPKAGGENGL